jgi:hypothetical protein
MMKQVLLKNWDLGHWQLFVIWCLVFGAYSGYGKAQQIIISQKNEITCDIYLFFLLAKISKGSPRIKAASAQRLWSKPVVLMERISGEKRLVFDSRWTISIFPL